MDWNGLVQYFNDSVVSKIIAITVAFAVILTLLMYSTLSMYMIVKYRPRPKHLGRIRMQKKYRFHQVVGAAEPGLFRLSPIVLAETNSFREAEKLRSRFPGTVAIVYDQTQQECENAKSN